MYWSVSGWYGVKNSFTSFFLRFCAGFFLSMMSPIIQEDLFRFYTFIFMFYFSIAFCFRKCRILNALAKYNCASRFTTQLLKWCQNFWRKEGINNNTKAWKIIRNMEMFVYFMLFVTLSFRFFFARSSQLIRFVSRNEGIHTYVCIELQFKYKHKQNVNFSTYLESNFERHQLFLYANIFQCKLKWYETRFVFIHFCRAIQCGWRFFHGFTLSKSDSIHEIIKSKERKSIRSVEGKKKNKYHNTFNSFALYF